MTAKEIIDLVKTRYPDAGISFDEDPHRPTDGWIDVIYRDEVFILHVNPTLKAGEFPYGILLKPDDDDEGFGLCSGESDSFFKNEEDFLKKLYEVMDDASKLG